MDMVLVRNYLIGLGLLFITHNCIAAEVISSNLITKDQYNELVDSSFQQTNKNIPTTNQKLTCKRSYSDNNRDLNILCSDKSRNFGKVGYIWHGISQDNGKTWSTLEPTKLPNPDTDFASITLQNGHMLLVYNHSQHSKFPLYVARSTDFGKTWKILLHLEEKTGEYFDPKIIAAQGNMVQIVYKSRPQGLVMEKFKRLAINLS